MGLKCVVPNCKSGYASCREEKVSIFKIPKEKLALWQKHIPRKDRLLTTSDGICEKHFDNSFIIRDVITPTYSYLLKRPRLADDAVPTLFPNCPKYLSSKVSKRRIIKKVEDFSQILVKKRKLNISGQSTTSQSTTSLISDLDINSTTLSSVLWEQPYCVTLPSKSWTLSTLPTNAENHSMLCFYDICQSENQRNVVMRKKVVLTAAEKAIPYFYIFEKLIDCKMVVEDLSTIRNVIDFENALKKLDSVMVCYGAMSTESCPKSFKSPFYFKDTILEVWKHVNCSYILSIEDDSKKCISCKRMRKALIYFKRSSNIPKIKSSRLTDGRLRNIKKREKRLRTQKCSMARELAMVKEKLDKTNALDFYEKIESLQNVSSAQKMLLKECISISKFKKKTSRKYSPEWLLLCLLFYIRGSASYRFIRENELLPLPSISTVRRYLSRIKIKCGLDDAFFQAFKLKMDEKSEYEKQGILIFDEIQVRKCINLNVTNMNLIGVQDFGEECPSATSETAEKCADHALVFMFASVGANINQPVAVYAAKGPTKGTCLAQLILAVIKQLEQIGVRIHALVCDGATSNRRMWKEFGISGELDNPVNKIMHPLSDARHLYFLSDAPHLIKCIRNRLLNKSVLNTPEGIVYWQHYKTLYHLEQKIPNNLRVCPRLTQYHVNPPHLFKMRVKLATQVFSNSVVMGLRHYKNYNRCLNNCEGTISFTQRYNYLFDVLNRRHPSEGIRRLSVDFQVLNENLAFLNKWEMMVQDGNISKDMFLTDNTAQGLRVSLLSTIELTNFLLSDCGFKYVLTNKMNQDPLERFFGIVRGAGGANDHPTLLTFLQLYRMLSAYKLLKPPSFGNCTTLEVEGTPKLTFTNFKSIFGKPQDVHTHLEKIKERIDAILINEDVSEDETESSIDLLCALYDPGIKETVDGIIYYLSGFICRKIYRSTQCSTCQQNLYSNTVIEGSLEGSSSITMLKTKGGLNHPSRTVYDFLSALENIIMKHIDSVNVFDNVVEDQLLLKCDINFPCKVHESEVLSKFIFFYTTMRVKQYYKQLDSLQNKSSAKKRKESRLQEN